MSLKELKKKYQEFLENTPNYLRQAKTLLKKDYLDYSSDEVLLFDNLYANNFNEPQNLDLNYKELENILYAYLGTAFVNYNGGNWELNNIKTDKAYGTPTIINWGGEDYPWTRCSPYVWKLIIERDGTLEERAIKRIFKYKE